MHIIALLAFCIAAVSAVPSNPQRIVGGSATTIEAYPTIAALLHSWNYVIYLQSCGGTILNTRSILTAAHCPHGDRVRQWRVRVGSTMAHSGGVVHNFNRVLFHPSFNRQNLDFDIALMRTDSVIAHNNAVRPASIAGANYNLADNQAVWAAGWGTMSSGGIPPERLRHVQIYTINQNICRQRYSPRTITNNMLCSGVLDVGGRDQCQGDSGGPLYHRGIVVGVCSFGRGCASPQFPGVNARVSTASTWIQNNA